MRPQFYAGRKTVFLLALLVALALSAVSCSSSPKNAEMPLQVTAGPTKPSPAPDWSERWLRGIPCRPPCWEGIIPGRISANVAVDLLTNSQFVGIVRTPIDHLMPERGEVDWTWVDGREGGRLIFEAQTISQTIYAIQPAFPTRFRLQDVIMAYGNPSHVIATAFRSPDLGGPISYDLSIIYLSLGLRLHTSSSGKPVTLNADTKFEDVTFSDPDRKELTAPQEFLVPWVGIKSFDFYCKDEENGNACRGNQ